MFHFAFLSWRERPDVPAGARALPYLEASGASQILPLLAFILTVETGGVHLVLHRWSVITAWIATALDIYALVFLLAVWRSLYLRPILLTPEALIIRIGFLFEATVPISEIASFHSVSGNFDGKRQGLLRNVLFSAPQFLVELNEPIIMRGVYGIRKLISTLAIAVDNPRPLSDWLKAATAVPLK